MKQITYRDKKYRRWAVLLLLAAIVLLGSKIKHDKSSDPGRSLGEWEDVHKWRKSGDCMDCHADNVTDGDLADLDKGVTIYPASFHTEEFKKFTHGHTDQVATESCLSCHEQSSCVTCHTQMPSTHTSDFTHPDGDGEGMKLHIMLGRLRPSSCLTCHNSFVDACMDCHTLSESEKWMAEGVKDLGKWGDIFNTNYVQQE